MKHHFSLTFQLNRSQAVNVATLAGGMPGQDFQVEADPLDNAKFCIHFQRDGDCSVELLNSAKEQVLNLVPDAELIAMDMTNELPMAGIVDDITKVVIQACQLFQEPELAHTWLNQPQPILNGDVPKVLMIEAEGRTQVSKVLLQLKQSMQGEN
ncbi:MbcA/ParS/Xre antitoxin family protein [Reinekea thalattae]|uniref:DUF2384 domain-containing protein n=1 Tax=Reinekea thalattae TaxID=2593301 RepID=A0A5C8Z4R7_9GAMM|nr:MbcA/ParS/Xre antitoxin family protein [Reinekea thalattae]TXR53085.1 DUF2384 domain-containing protein [Reinekea thalattae]